MDLHKKVIGNAVSAYFMVFISILFLFNKSPYINHSFVKSHVKSAFFIHILLFLLILFIIKFNFLSFIYIFGYSIGTIISSFLFLFLFGMLLYGAWRAHRGETLSIGEIFHISGIKKEVLQHSQMQDFTEEDTLHLILAHIPFLGYITYPQHKKLPHIRDISILNMLITLFSIFIFALGYSSLASIIILLYTIWSVFQSLRLIFEDKLITFDMSFIQAAEETYILQKSLLTYIGNTLRKNIFIKLSDIIETKTQARYKKELAELEILKIKKTSPLPTWVFYIPGINLIGLLFLNSQDTFHIKNGIIISIFFALCAFFIAWDSPLLLFTLLPIFYGIGYSNRKAYRMPYIYDFYAFFANISTSIAKLFHKTRKLQKTDTSSTLTMNKTKKES